MRRATSIGLLVTALAALIRIWGLGSPATTYGDESWYVFDAATYLGGGVALGQLGEPPPVKIDEEVTWMHPPLGKWTIALGVGPLGGIPWGWRLPSALFGTATVLLVYLIGLALWDSPGWAGAAAALLALDGLHIVQSRMAMLDVFVTAWVVGGVFFLVRERERHRGALPPDSGRLTDWFGSRDQLLAGLCLGAAVATKWSGISMLILAWIASAAWIIDPDVRGIKRQTVVALGLIPLAVYAASYFQFFFQHGADIGGFLTLQREMLSFHLHHVIDAPSRSSPWGWPLLLKALPYWPTAGKSVTVSSTRVLALGNPVLWWTFLATLPVLAWATVKRKRWDAGLAISCYAVSYLPWLLVPRTAFLWYMLPAVPFMCIGVVASIRSLPERWRIRAGVGVVGAATVAGIAFMPLWLDLGAPWSHWLMWLPGWRP